MRQGLLLIPAMVFSAVVAHRAHCAEPSSTDAINAELAKLSKKYGIEILAAKEPISIALSNGQISGKQTTPKNLAPYVLQFATEWNLYPPEVVAQSGLRRVIFCDEVSWQGRPCGGASDYQHADIYLDISGRYGKFFLRKHIHHEFFHMIDYHDDGLKDERWQTLNPTGFQYAIVVNDVQKDPYSVSLKNRTPGFLNSYSKTAVPEDKAEIYAHMVTIGRAVEDWTKTDAVLRAKVARIKDILQKTYPIIDDNFWQAARKISRPGA